jgi:hypothetical protein
MQEVTSMPHQSRHQESLAALVLFSHAGYFPRGLKSPPRRYPAEIAGTGQRQAFCWCIHCCHNPAACLGNLLLAGHHQTNTVNRF